MKRNILQGALLLALPPLLGGCYVVPMGSDQIGKLTALLEAQNAPQPAKPAAVEVKAAEPKTVPAAPTGPAALQARLYPVNDIATENGMVSGTVTNMMNGKGRLQLSYRGELLTGEATRVVGDERKGIASAWGGNGSFMSCEYQMSSPVRGAGTCNFSDGARYTVHVGN